MTSVESSHVNSEPFSLTKQLPALIFACGLVICFGIFERLSNIDRMFMWHDEAISYITLVDRTGVQLDGVLMPAKDYAKLSNPRPLGFGRMFKQAKLFSPDHTLLFPCLTLEWTKVFGNSISSLRMFSAAVSLLEIPLIGWLCYELLRDLRTAMMAAALNAVSPFFLLYAHEAREYSLWTCTILMTGIFLTRALRDNERRDWLLFAFAQILALLTHYATVLWICGQILIVLSARRRVLFQRFVLASLPACVLMFACLLFAGGNAFTKNAAVGWLSHPTPLREYIYEFAVNLTRVFFDTGTAFPSELNMLIGVLTFGELILIIRLLLVKTPGRAFLLASIVGCATPLILVDLAFGGIRTIVMRYLIPSIIGLEILVANAIASNWSSSLRWYRALSICCGIIMISLGIVSCLSIAKLTNCWSKPLWEEKVAAQQINAQQINAQRINAQRINADANILWLSDNEFQLLTICQFLRPDTLCELVWEKAPNIPQTIDTIYMSIQSNEIIKNCGLDEWNEVGHFGHFVKYRVLKRPTSGD